MFIICRSCGKCQFCSHPYAGNTHDLAIFYHESNEIHFGMKNDSFIIADRIFYSPSNPHTKDVLIGYRKPIFTLEQEHFNYGISSIRQLIERFNWRFKDFQKVFTEKWKSHNFFHHELLIKSYMNIINIDIEFHPFVSLL